MSTKPSKWRKRLLIVVVLLLVGGGVTAYFMGVPIPGLSPNGKESAAATPKRPEPLKVELLEWFKITDKTLASLSAAEAPETVTAKIKPLKDKLFESRETFKKALGEKLDAEELKQFQAQILSLAELKQHAVSVPVEVRDSLGIRKAGLDLFSIAERPKGKRPLVLSASTMWDPATVYHNRVRFTPAQAVKIATVPALEGTRELRPGDHVSAKQEIAVFYSVDVGMKKADLIDALVQMKLDEDLLMKASTSAAIPEAFRSTLERNVQSDINTINRAIRVLELWDIDPDEIKAVISEADELFKVRAKQDFKKFEPKLNADRKNDKWGKVVIKAPGGGYIVERNFALNEIVNDPNLNLITIAKTDRLLVMANAPEEDLRELYGEWKEFGLKWTIRTLGAPDSDGIAGSIENIGQLVDPNQHTVPVKGIIPNADGLLRAGQYVTATIELRPPADVVSIPANAVLDDGKQAVVFVRNPKKPEELTMRRVMVTHRFEDRVFVRSVLKSKESEPTIEEKEQGIAGKEPLQLGEQVILSGLLELKKELEDRESDRGK